MALDQSALLDLLGQLKFTDVSDRIRTATETLYQRLIDAEATAFIGAAPFERSDAPQCFKKPGKTYSRSPDSRPGTGARTGPRTPWNG